MLLIRIIDSRMKPPKTQKGIMANTINYLLEIVLEISLGVLLSIKGILSIIIPLPRKKDMVESIFFDHLRQTIRQEKIVDLDEPFKEITVFSSLQLLHPKDALLIDWLKLVKKIVGDKFIGFLLFINVLIFIIIFPENLQEAHWFQLEESM